MQHDVRDFHQNLDGIKNDKDIVEKFLVEKESGTQVTAEEQEAFARDVEGASQPTLFPLRVYWPFVRVPWNLALAALFAEVFLKVNTELADQRNEIEEHFLARLKQQRRLIVGPATLSDDPVEVKQIHEAQVLQWRERSHLNERQVQLFNSRRDITNELRHEPASDQTKAWKILFWMVESLGSQGMSSDESDPEDRRVGRRGPKTVRQREWRSDEVMELLIFIDEHKKQVGPSGGALPGTEPRKRRRLLTAPVSDWRAIAQLPINFYRADWLNGLSEEDIKALEPQTAITLPKFRYDEE